jgi:hypothetical protein
LAQINFGEQLLVSVDVIAYETGIIAKHILLTAEELKLKIKLNNVSVSRKQFTELM